MFVLVGYSNSSSSNKQYVSIGTYVMQESKDIVKPFVLLEDNNRFTFNYSALSSYIPVGSYEVDNDVLILKTDDDEYKYLFQIKDNTLIFKSSKSSEIPSFANVYNGSIFK